MSEARTWVSISAYARTWGLTRNTVYKLLENGDLEVYQLAGTVDLIRIKNIAPDQHQHIPKPSE